MDNENTEAAISAGVQLLCTNSTARVNATSSSIQCLRVVFADTAAFVRSMWDVLRLHFDQLLDTVHVQTPLFQLLLHHGNLEQLENLWLTITILHPAYPEYCNHVFCLRMNFPWGYLSEMLSRSKTEPPLSLTWTLSPGVRQNHLSRSPGPCLQE